MVLSGLLFPFEKLNDAISTKGNVPVVADLMASRWGFEAMAVYHFVNNSYQFPYYQFDKIKAQANFRAAYLADALQQKRKFIEDHLYEGDDSVVRRCVMTSC